MVESPVARPRRFTTRPEDGRASNKAPVSTPYGTYRHTTHLSSIFQVCYPYHPFFGQTVKLVRRIRRQTSDSVIIKLPDGLEIAIPFWMLDPLACNEVKDADAPFVSTNALLALDELLKSSGLLLPKPSSTSGPSQSKGVSDVPESFGPSSPPNPGDGGSRPQPPVSGASRRTPDLRHSQRTEPGEQP